MNGFIAGIAGVVLFALITGGVMCAKLQTIEPGHVGVSIQKCGKGGVKPDPIPSGYYWRELFCEEVEEYPTFQQLLILTASQHEGKPQNDAIIVQSSEGLPINVDVSLSFILDAKKVPMLYVKYREDIDQIKETYVRQSLREAMQEVFSKYSAEQLYSTHKHIAVVEVQKFLADRLKDDGMMVNQVTINEMRLPEQVKNSINAKVAIMQDSQKAEAEVRKTQALAAQRVAQAKGEAEAKRMMADAEAYFNKTVASSITPSLVQYELVKAQMSAIQKWNGAMPQMTGSGAVPFINVH